ncbi:MAG: DUF1997 domain-containing protein [Candidatus Sericytochromatia bacterium]|nr:DUF1997 domain-containing protein [Candidatus Sericytochromatia bacterium]
MIPLDLEATVRHDIRLPVSPGEAFEYFSGNDDLLREFLGAERVESLGQGCFRVRLNPHGAFGWRIQPCFDVKFVDYPPDRIEMRSLEASLMSGSANTTRFDAGFCGTAHFRQDPRGCCVSCEASMQVTIGIPDWVRMLMPPGALAQFGNGMIRAAMQGLAARLGPLLERGIAASLPGKAPRSEIG